jgi:hypothetical protein
MTRTQILLKEEEHRFLAKEAARQGISVSAYIRALVEEKMESTSREETPVAAIIGMIKDTSGFSGADHDGVLYGPVARPIK